MINDVNFDDTDLLSIRTPQDLGMTAIWFLLV